MKYIFTCVTFSLLVLTALIYIANKDLHFYGRPIAGDIVAIKDLQKDDDFQFKVHDIIILDEEPRSFAVIGPMDSLERHQLLTSIDSTAIPDNQSQWAIGIIKSDDCDNEQLDLFVVLSDVRLNKSVS